ncbi:MAG: histidinol-phosphate transaminase [Terricaulis sp.]
MSAPRPKQTILEIEPYKAGRATAPGFAKPIKISANENPLGASPKARAAYLDAADKLHFYPDPRAGILREAIAAKYALDPARIVFGTGSDELFSLVCSAYLSPGDVMVQPQWAFAAWAIAARAAGAAVRAAPERDYHVDVDAMLAAVDANTRVVFMANPANPTGTRIPRSEVVRFHKALRPDIVLVLDEAYAEFAQEPDDFSLADQPNVLITRTLSKLYGLASLRVGWGYGPADMIETLNKIRLPFNLSVPAIAAAHAALADDTFAERSIAHAVGGRDKISKLVTDLGLIAVPSATNFVTARFPKDFPIAAPEATAALAERGVLVRGLEPYGMHDCFRISISTDEDWPAVEAALRAVIKR